MSRARLNQPAVTPRPGRHDSLLHRGGRFGKGRGTAGLGPPARSCGPGAEGSDVEGPEVGIDVGPAAISTMTHRSHRDPCLEMRPRRGLNVARAHRGSETSPEAQPIRGGEPMHVPRLGDHHCRGDCTDPRAGSETGNARIGPEQRANLPLSHLDLGGEASII